MQNYVLFGTSSSDYSCFAMTRCQVGVYRLPNHVFLSKKNAQGFLSLVLT